MFLCPHFSFKSEKSKKKAKHDDESAKVDLDVQSNGLCFSFNSRMDIAFVLSFWFIMHYFSHTYFQPFTNFPVL